MTKTRQLIATYRTPLLLLAALVPALFAVIDYAYSLNNGSMGTSVYYFVGYDTGFGGRKLLGTLYSLVLPQYVTWHHLRPYIIAINLAMLLLFAAFALQTLRRLRDDRLAAPLLVAYLASPFSILGYVESSMSIYFTETYTLALTLLWLLLYVACPRRWWYYLLTAAIAVCATLIHHTFCCTFFPLMVALMIHDAWDGHRIDWHRAIPYGLICATLAALLATIWFLSPMNIDCNELHQRIIARTSDDAYCRGSMIRDYYYQSTSEGYNRFGFTGWASGPLRMPVEFVLTLLMLLPLFAGLALPILLAIRQTRRQHAAWRYRLPLLAVILMTLPIFLMATDYGRWWTALSFSLFALPLALAARGDQPMRQALADLYAFCRRHLLLSAVVVIYLLQLHPHPQYPYFGLQQAMRLRELMGF